MKAKIIKIGEFKDGKPILWVFDCLGSVPLSEVLLTGETLYAGYTLEELKDIAEDVKNDPKT